jgi:hypothetical protein
LSRVDDALGLDGDQAPDPDRYIWRPVPNGDVNVPPLAHRLLRSVAERQRWRAAMRPRGGEVSALRRMDADLDAGTVRVRAAFFERSTGGLVLSPPKSKAG